MVTAKVKGPTKTDVRIGISDTTQEINFECASTQSEVIAKVNEAIKSATVLSLSDTKGREILVPHTKISFVEVGESAERRVGFANNN